MLAYLSAESVGALRIEGERQPVREALRHAYRVRRMPPPPWAGAYVRLTLHALGGGSLRAWEYLAGQWHRVG